MKKRETLLIQILICIALFTGVFKFFLEPVLDAKEALKAEQQSVQLQKTNMDQLIAADLETAKGTETKRADENYLFFYGVLNSYNIDEIVNSLARENGLSTQSFSIGDYEDATGDFGTGTDNTNTENDGNTDKAQLLKCSVSLTVSGNYENILTFVDRMNAKSSCLKTTSLSITENKQAASSSYSHTAQIEITIYGVNTIAER